MNAVACGARENQPKFEEIVRKINKIQVLFLSAPSKIHLKLISAPADRQTAS